jgi:hypothetical protein
MFIAHLVRLLQFISCMSSNSGQDETSNDLGKMWKEAVVACLRQYTRTFLEKLNETTEESQSV